LTIVFKNMEVITDLEKSNLEWWDRAQEANGNSKSK
jgi:hypothetical protein